MSTIDDLAKAISSKSPVTAPQPDVPTTGGIGIIRNTGNADGTLTIYYNGANDAICTPLTNFVPVVGNTILVLVIGSQLWGIGTPQSPEITPVVDTPVPAGYAVQTTPQLIGSAVSGGQLITTLDLQWATGGMIWNDTQFIIPQKGVYLVIGSVDWAVNVGPYGFQSILYYNNASAQGYAQQLYANPAVAGAINPIFSGLLPANEGDIIGLGAQQLSPTSQYTQDLNNRTSLSIAYFGPSI